MPKLRPASINDQLQLQLLNVSPPTPSLALALVLLLCSTHGFTWWFLCEPDPLRLGLLESSRAYDPSRSAWTVCWPRASIRRDSQLLRFKPLIRTTHIARSQHNVGRNVEVLSWRCECRPLSSCHASTTDIYHIVSVSSLLAISEYHFQVVDMPML